VRKFDVLLNVRLPRSLLLAVAGAFGAAGRPLSYAVREALAFAVRNVVHDDPAPPPPGVTGQVEAGNGAQGAGPPLTDQPSEPLL
jgi:hypothetical protein